jgi:antitoxin ParD1/3/4
MLFHEEDSYCKLTDCPGTISLNRNDHSEFKMPKRNVELTAHFDRFVDRQVASGRYEDVSDVMRAGLRLLEPSSRQEEEKLAILRDLAAEAFDAIDHGGGIAIEGEEALAELVAGIGRRAARRVQRGQAGAS